MSIIALHIMSIVLGDGVNCFVWRIVILSNKLHFTSKANQDDRMNITEISEHDRKIDKDEC